MRPHHVPAVVDIYRASFVGAFLVKLGPRFLDLMFTAFIAGSPRECSLVCLNSDNIVMGFACGSENRAGYLRSFMRQHLADSLPGVVGAIFRDPAIGIGLLRRIRTLTGDLSRGLMMSSRTHEYLPAASLMTIAVADKWRGRGVGRSLVEAFMVAMAKRGVPELRLAVSEGNVTARRLYERLGWRVAPAVRHNTSNRYYIRRLVPLDERGE
jgi:ribosomal protein S18 acetylase RimI-like enzyme